MSLTLTVGAIEKQLVLHDGLVYEHEVVHLDISFDHDVIDGAPTMRFADHLKELLRSGVEELVRPESGPTVPVVARGGG